MKPRNKPVSADPDNILVKQLDKLVALNENSIIIELALRGIPQQDIRKIVKCDMRQVTKISKPVKKVLKKLLKKEQKNKK